MLSIKKHFQYFLHIQYSHQNTKTSIWFQYPNNQLMCIHMKYKQNLTKHF